MVASDKAATEVRNVERRDRVAVVTGANRGLGLETVRQLTGGGYRVVAASRDATTGEQALTRAGLSRRRASVLALDVTSGDDIARAARSLREDPGAIDALVNNAGVSLDGFDQHVARRTLAVNLFGAIAITDALLPLLSTHATITMVSSGLGELSCLSPALRAEFEDPGLTRGRLTALMHDFIDAVAAGTHSADGWPSSAYNVSKVGMNAFTRILAREQRETSLRINAVCPGWVRTDMGGSAASRAVEEGAAGIVWAATLPPDGPSGGFFRDGQPKPW